VTIKINGHEKRIGLALSGGGFRAAGFHLGVMRELQRLGILPTLDLVSCVSGGSIAGGMLVANWGNPPEGLNKLEKYLKTRSIAVASVIGGILDPFESRLDKLAASYDRDLFAGVTLAALKNGPRVYFNTTNLATGNLFFFVAGGGGEEELGEHELGTGKDSNFLVSRAVAASSAFPPSSHRFGCIRTSINQGPQWNTSRSPTAACTTTWLSIRSCVWPAMRSTT
jgi:NTE family protein